MYSPVGSLGIRDLIKKASTYEDIDEGVIRRMELKYAAAVTLALQTQNATLAMDSYYQAKQLPATTTVQQLTIKGYRVNGPLFEGSPIVICYKGTKSFLIKYLDRYENRRRADLERALGGETHPNIVSYEIFTKSDGDTSSLDKKTYMIMPRFMTTLEPLPQLDDTDVRKLWEDIDKALTFLHNHGFAFMDVKPSNICIDERGNYVLIDLGSVTPFSTTSSCTQAYLPSDMQSTNSVVGSAAVDWWMLAMTVAEKVGPDASPDQGPKRRTKEQVLTYLGIHVSSSLLTDIETKLRLS